MAPTIILIFQSILLFNAYYVKSVLNKNIIPSLVIGIFIIFEFFLIIFPFELLVDWIRIDSSYCEFIHELSLISVMIYCLLYFLHYIKFYHYSFKGSFFLDSKVKASLIIVWLLLATLFIVLIITDAIDTHGIVTTIIFENNNNDKNINGNGNNFLYCDAESQEPILLIVCAMMVILVGNIFYLIYFLWLLRQVTLYFLIAFFIVVVFCASLVFFFFDHTFRFSTDLSVCIKYTKEILFLCKDKGLGGCTVK